jgi:hypothetical protein
MYDARNAVIAEDLRFALDVLQESAHLGLDSEHSSTLQSLIQNQIKRREARLRRSAPVVETPEPIREEVAV